MSNNVIEMILYILVYWFSRWMISSKSIIKRLLKMRFYMLELGRSQCLSLEVLYIPKLTAANETKKKPMKSEFAHT